MGGTIGKDMLTILGIFLLFFIGWIFLGGPSGAFEGTGPRTPGSGFSFVPKVGGLGFTDASVDQGAEQEIPQDNSPIPPENLSPWAGQVRLSVGNARSQDDPDKEYVTITASRVDEAVAISGWTLANNRVANFVRGQNNERNRANSEIVTIPQGARIVSNTGRSALGPIVLERKGKAYVVTGEAPKKFPVLLNTSFLETKCTPYFRETENFEPRMLGTCPDPDNEPGAENLSDDCYRFVRGIRQCQTPDSQRMELLSNQCRSYVRDHFDYQGCVQNYRHDEDFFGTTWRVYLDFPRELWHSGRDTITLYDQNGLVVDQIQYD